MIPNNIHNSLTTHVCVCVYIYIYIYIIQQYEEKVEKTNNPKFDEFVMKVDMYRFGYNLLQDFKLMKNVVKIVMGV